MDARKPRESRPVGADRRFSREKRRWSEYKWQRGYRSSRVEQTNPEKPTTSNDRSTNRFDNQPHLQLNALLKSDKTSAYVMKPLKSIVKTGTQAKSTSTVRFELPPVTEIPEERTKKPSLLDRYRRLRDRPACRLLTGLIFCAVLPCCLIYLGIHYANKLNTRKEAFFRGKSFT